MKKCSKCGQILDESCFSVIGKNNPNLRSWCKRCSADYTKAYTERKKLEQSEKYISNVITKNAVDNIFDIRNIKDIPNKIKKTLKLPKKLIGEDANSNNFIIRSNISNVLRRSNGAVHLSQIQVAYYRMYGELIKSRSLSIQLSVLKKHDNKLTNPMKGYYLYNKGE